MIMNNIVNRRRVYVEESGIPIERPEYIRMDFTTTSDNYTFGYGYFCRSNYNIILDDEVATKSGTESAPSFIVPNAGEHVVYIRPGGPGWTSTGYNIHPPKSLIYMRLPYNISTVMKAVIKLNAWSQTIGTLDILDEDFVSNIDKSGYGGVYSACGSIRVPIGTKQKYIDNGINLAKMTEVKFKYTI